MGKIFDFARRGCAVGTSSIAKLMRNRTTVTIPQSKIKRFLTAPFAQGSLWVRLHRLGKLEFDEGGIYHETYMAKQI